ncbi:MAG: trigger factor [Spirochaetales bacterium]|jgi:trigger factor|nr:trigger factor [Spirochaetales bacterium]
MITKKDLQLLENSSAKLTLTLSQEQVREEYDKLLQQHLKTARIRGFRQGKVPPAILEQKYGGGLRAETTMSLIEESLKEALAGMEPPAVSYEPPVLEGDPLVELGQDFTFTVTFDVMPKIKLGPVSGLEITLPRTEIEEEDLNRELDILRDQNSIVKEKAGGPAEKGDIASIDYWQIDETGAIDPGSRREDFVFTVGSGYNLFQLDEDILGMNPGEEKIIDKTFPPDHPDPGLAGKSAKIGVKLNSLKVKELPELDDALAQDINEKFETLADLKKSIREALEKQLAERLEDLKRDELLKQIVDATEMGLPGSLIKVELESRWRSFVIQSRLPEEQILKIFQNEGKTKEDFFKDWTPLAEQRVKQQLILSHLKETEEITVLDEELEEEINHQAQHSRLSYEDTLDYLERNGILGYLKSDIENKKLFDKLLSRCTIKEGEKISFIDLTSKKR